MAKRSHGDGGIDERGEEAENGAPAVELFWQSRI
jgi:hypothetical protein